MHFFWVARLSDLTTVCAHRPPPPRTACDHHRHRRARRRRARRRRARRRRAVTAWLRLPPSPAIFPQFKWLLVMLPELKRLQLVHNQYYSGDSARKEQLTIRLKELRRRVSVDPNRPPPPAALPPGWAESRTPTGELFFYNQATNETSWVRPHGGEAPPSAAAPDELQAVQAGLREASSNSRTLSITLYLTGCKPEQIKPQDNPKPNSPAEMINALLSTVDPDTGEAYITLKAGRPDWDGEFRSVSDTYGREDVGVVFCGAPAIAAALKDACEMHSNSAKTVFRLHKENF